MPSTHDNSSTTGSFSTPRSRPPEIPGKAASPTAAARGSNPDWLAAYMTDRMTAAGVDVVTAGTVAGEMQTAIVSAFSTLARYGDC